MNKYGIIYKITNKVNGKVYIGQTTKKAGFNGRYNAKGEGIERVYNKYCADDRYNVHLKRSIEKYGFDSFDVDKEFDIAYSQEELNNKEIYWIDYYDSTNPKKGYNILVGGEDKSKYDKMITAFITSLTLSLAFNRTIDIIRKEHIFIPHVTRPKLINIENIINTYGYDSKIKKCNICGKYFANKGSVCNECLNGNNIKIRNLKQTKKKVIYMSKNPHLFVNESIVENYSNNLLEDATRYYLKEGVDITNHDEDIIKSFKEKSIRKFVFALIIANKFSLFNNFTYSINDLKHVYNFKNSTETEIKDVFKDNKYIHINSDNTFYIDYSSFSNEEKSLFKVYSLECIQKQYKYRFVDDTGYKLCTICNMPYKSKSSTSKYCEKCRDKMYKEQAKKYKKNKRGC